MQPQLSNRVIGHRVKAARESVGWNQEQLAEALGFNDRQSVSDLENGKRRVQADELVAISDALNRDIEFFLEPFAVVGEAQFSWRASNELPQNFLDDFEWRAGQWIGLLRWLREGEIGRINPLKQSLRLNSDSTFEQAMSRAQDLVQSLELGQIPAQRLIECVEHKLDIPVLFVDAVTTPEGYSISGATCHLQDLSVILINRHETEARRYYDLAHELFHALTWDAMQPDHRESNALESRGRTKRIEQLANNFAAALLMPKRSLDQMIDPQRMGEVGHLAEVALALCVAPAALAWRLYNIKMINEDTRDALKNIRQRPSSAGTPKRLSHDFVVMLHSSIDKGRISVRKAAKALGMNLPQLAELFTERSLAVPYEQ